MINPINPIERERYLYGNKWGWFFLSIIFSIITIAIIWFISKHCLGVSAQSLLDREDNNHGNLLYAIISQFANPGNLPKAQGSNSTFIAFLCVIGGIILLSGLTVSSKVFWEAP